MPSSSRLEGQEERQGVSSFVFPSPWTEQIRKDQWAGKGRKRRNVMVITDYSDKLLWLLTLSFLAWDIGVVV